jgi:uncharacterized protein (TIGR00251 family)
VAVAWARRDGRDLVIDVHVQPRASRSEFAGTWGDRLKLRLKAPPVDGRANEELVAFLALEFGVPRRSVRVEQGLSGRDKRVRIVDAPPLEARLEDIAGDR